MEIKNISRIFKTGLLLVMSIAVLTACQTLPSRPPEAALEQRVKGLMKAKINQNWARLYTYLDPSYQETVSRKNFVNRQREAMYSDFSIESIQIKPSGREAVAEVLFDMTVKSFEFKDQRDVQNWVKKDEKWYLKTQPANALDFKPTAPGTN